MEAGMGLPIGVAYEAATGHQIGGCRIVYEDAQYVALEAARSTTEMRLGPIEQKRNDVISSWSYFQIGESRGVLRMHHADNLPLVLGDPNVGEGDAVDATAAVHVLPSGLEPGVKQVAGYEALDQKPIDGFVVAIWVVGPNGDRHSAIVAR
jgi:hypothetical protein